MRLHGHAWRPKAWLQSPKKSSAKSGAASTVVTFNYFSGRAVPNWAVKRTPTLAMASPSSWPVLVPYALTGSGAAYLGR